MAAISKFQKLVLSNEQTLSEKNQEMQELERQRTAEVSQLAMQNKAEKTSVVQSYESALAELKMNIGATWRDCHGICCKQNRRSESSRRP
jgi:cupin superfamily acireductone dioxygenase involved in methionine salvage